MKEESAQYISNPFKLLSPSWQAVKLNFWTFVKVILIVIAVFALPAVLLAVGSGALSVRDQFEGVVGVVFALLAIALVVTLLYLGIRYGAVWHYILLQSSKGIKLGAKQAFNESQPYGFRVLAYSLLYSLIVFIGFLLLIIPGVYWATRYAMGPYAIIEENLGIQAAMRRSKELSQGRFWDVFGPMSMSQAFGALSIVPILGTIAMWVLQVMYAAAIPIRYLMLKSAKENATTLPPVSPWNYFVLVLALLGLIATVAFAISDIQKQQEAGPSYTIEEGAY